MDEEEEYIYGQGLRKDFIEGAKDLSSDAVDYIKENPAQSGGVGVTSVSILGNLIKNKGITNFKPGQFLNSPMEKQFVKRGTASLTNPKYLKFLGDAGSKVATSRGVIPVLASLMASDLVKAKEGEALAEMSDIDRYQRDQEQAGIDRAENIAQTMRKYNIIEEQMAERENRLPYGYDPDFPEEGANINVTNFRDYLAQVPEGYRGPDELDFSSIDLSGQSEFPYYKDQSRNTGIDFSKFEQTEQGQPNLSALNQGSEETDYVEMARNMLYPNQDKDLLSSTNPNYQPETPKTPETRSGGISPDAPISIYTDYLSNLREQGVSDDERVKIAAKMMKPYMTTTHEQHLAENERVFEAARQDRLRKEQEAAMRAQEDYDNLPGSVRRMKERLRDDYMPTMKMTDFRAILRKQGIKGKAQTALAKQMMIEHQNALKTGALQSQKYVEDIKKAREPKAQRAPTRQEYDFGIIQTLEPLRQKLAAGMNLSEAEQSIYNAGTAYLNMGLDQYSNTVFPSIDSFSADEGEISSLPDAESSEGEKIIEQVMAGNPGKTREEVIDALREKGKLR